MFEFYRKLVIVTLVALCASACGASSSSDEVCAELEKAARDPQVALYLRNWFSHKLQEEEFVSQFSYGGNLSAYEKPQVVSSLDLDWQLLGIDNRFALFSLHHPELSGNAKFDKNLVSYAGVGQARNLIVVALAPDGQEESAASVTDAPSYHYMGNGVYLSCEP